ncbi:glycosyl transferase [Winogradskyella undariae]|uniref:glycosyl transferase n=1 Tax=Winogradskyella TaxID=286104 RepID=UPI00156B8652|nr:MULTISPECIES: glycosyl transferase [Winogradskyella]NRR91024.1 glycosyl transferase [Winogradskyella undariae]QXP80028.1 glycosyl transferase [Winogradskyella sp. HaHa_3_26]
MKKDIFNTPILIICFNRPQYISKQVEAIKLALPSTIYIYSDGPRQNNLDDIRKTKKVITLYNELIDWECDVKFFSNEKNLGCSRGPISAMSWFFNHVEMGIILEDDIIPSIDFFKFSQEMLENYRDDRRVISISGCNLGFEGVPNSYFYSNIMNMWGWATWRDRFEEVDFDMTSWEGKRNKLYFLYDKLKNGTFDLDINWWIYWKTIFDKTVSFSKDRVTWWDYQFIYHQLNNNQYSIFPNRNLIKNIGFDSDATHTGQINNPVRFLKSKQLDFPIQVNNELKNNKEFYEFFLKPLWAFYNRPNWKFYFGKLFKKNK